jgi:hypothetical protein
MTKNSKKGATPAEEQVTPQVNNAAETTTNAAEKFSYPEPTVTPTVVPDRVTGEKVTRFANGRGMMRLQQLVAVQKRGSIEFEKRYCTYYGGNADMLAKTDITKGRICVTDVEDRGSETDLPEEARQQIGNKGTWDERTVRYVRRTKDKERVYVSENGYTVLRFYWFSTNPNEKDSILSAKPFTEQEYNDTYGYNDADTAAE